MSFRVLDMVIISAKDSKQVNFKMKVFALASVQGYNNNLYNSLQKTPIDKDGGSFPMKFLIDVDAAEKNCLTLVIKLKADRFCGDKDIGEVHVPVKELLDNYGAPNDRMRKSYSVRSTRSGKIKGVLDFSFNFGDAVVSAPALAPPTPGGHPPQMQPQEETCICRELAQRIGECILCGVVRIAAEEVISNNIGS